MRCHPISPALLPQASFLGSCSGSGHLIVHQDSSDSLCWPPPFSFPLINPYTHCSGNLLRLGNVEPPMVSRGLRQNKPPHHLAVSTSHLQSDPGLRSSCAEGTNNPSTWGTVVWTCCQALLALCIGKAAHPTLSLLHSNW